MMVRNEVVERGSVTNSQKGKKAYVERKVRECFSVEGTWTLFQRRLMKFQSWHSSLWKQWRRLETKRTIVFSCILFEGKTDWRRDTKNPHSDQVNRKTRETRVKCHADSVCKNPSCKFWHPLVCLNYKSGKVVYMAITAISDMLRQRRSPTRSRRKVVQKDQLLCKRCLRESGKIEIETRRQILQRHGTKLELGKERVHREELSKSVRLMSVVFAPKFGERSHEETWHQEGCARKAAWDLAKHFRKLRNSDKDSVLLHSCWS